MKKIVFFAAALALLAMSSAAQATLLPPGTTVVPLVPSSVSPGATLVGLATGTFPLPTDPTGGPTGSYREAVFQEAGGTLDFAFQITVNGTSPDDVARISSLGYKGLIVDADQQSGPLGNAALLAAGFTDGTVFASSADRKPNGGTVGFNFSPSIGPGTTSYIEVFQTDATIFNRGTFGISDGVTSNVNGFVPGPEPTSLVLFGGLAFGLGGAGMRRWRQQRKDVTA